MSLLFMGTETDVPSFFPTTAPSIVMEPELIPINYNSLPIQTLTSWMRASYVSGVTKTLAKSIARSTRTRLGMVDVHF